MQSYPDIRKALRNARRSMPADQHQRAAEALAQQILSLSSFPQSGYVAGYWAVDGEISLHVLQQRLPRNAIWCLPVLDEASKQLKFAPWQIGDALINNSYGIPEPRHTRYTLLHARKMDLIVLPLTGFDSRCHRLGMGGGWYDRTLQFCKQSPPDRRPVLVGAGFDIQELARIEPEPWDVGCDHIATETRLLTRER